MAIRTVVTRGYGNGVFNGTIPLVTTRGYLGIAAPTIPTYPLIQFDILHVGMKFWFENIKYIKVRAQFRKDYGFVNARNLTTGTYRFFMSDQKVVPDGDHYLRFIAPMVCRPVPRARLAPQELAPALVYRNKVLSYSPIGYWPLKERWGAVAYSTPATMNGTHTDVTLGYLPGPVEGELTGLWNGITSVSDLLTSALATAFNGQEITVSLWIKIGDSALWNDGTSRTFLNLYCDASNSLQMYKTAAVNTLAFAYRANADSELATTTAAGGDPDWVHVALTASYSADAFKAYAYGSQVDTTKTGLGAFGAVALTVADLGEDWYGELAHLAIFDYALTPSSILDLATIL